MSRLAGELRWLSAEEEAAVAAALGGDFDELHPQDYLEHDPAQASDEPAAPAANAAEEVEAQSGPMERDSEPAAEARGGGDSSGAGVGKRPASSLAPPPPDGPDPAAVVEAVRACAALAAARLEDLARIRAAKRACV